MKIVRVEYVVQQEFVAQNKANIMKVMDEVKSMNLVGFKYWSQLAEDGVSFMHIAISEEGVESPLNSMDCFNDFRTALKGSGLVSPPKATNYDLVGAGFNIF